MNRWYCLCMVECSERALCLLMLFQIAHNFFEFHKM